MHTQPISKIGESKREMEVGFCPFPYSATPGGQSNNYPAFPSVPLEQLSNDFTVEVNGNLTGIQEAFWRKMTCASHLWMLLVPALRSPFSFLPNLTVTNCI